MQNEFAVRLHSLAAAVVGLLCVGFFSASYVDAADSAGANDRYALRSGMNEFGVWAGGSPGNSRIIGKVEDRQLLLFALRYGRILSTWEFLALEYTFDIFPAAVYFEPGDVRRGSSTIYGAGLSPIGFKLNFAPQSWIQPFFAASVGFLYFMHDVPVPDSSRFNFTPELGVGLQFFFAPKRALTLGYKLHHISNANTGESNPGMDSHVIYAGISFFTP
jgi:lipid A 3-O-deacylase PagL